LLQKVRNYFVEGFEAALGFMLWMKMT